MRCIRCHSDNKLKERQASGGRCKNCGHPFAFDPKVSPGVNFTDKFFEQSLSLLSVENSLYFTQRQLYYFINHRLESRRTDPWKVAGWVALIGGPVLAFLLFTVGAELSLAWLFPPLLFAAGLALLASPALRRRLRSDGPREPHAMPGEVAGWYDRWRSVNGEAVKLLPPPPAAGRAGRAVQLSPEVTSYSFDRVVVCDRAEVAHCLIANNFHFEHNCAVLSLDGYPHDLFETVMGMLRRNSSLSVYALHDASVPGVSLPHILRTEPKWFAGGGATVYDLGLLPRQVFDRRVFVENWLSSGHPALRSIPPDVAATLTPDEVRWLEAGNYVSLESFTPQTLLRVVAQGIARSRDPQAGDALVPVAVGGDGGGGAYLIYTSDTFG